MMEASKPRLDHLLWAVPDLAQGIDEMARQTGVRACLGGRHPGVGTHNALLDLGAEGYLEIIAPDPTQDALSGLGRHLESLHEPRLITWAVRTWDIAAIERRARAAGLVPEGIVAMSRQRPDGRQLAWRILELGGHDEGGLIPFFIEWQGDEHPSHDAPGGCRLEDFVLEPPVPSKIHELLAVLGLAVEVRRGSRPRLLASLSTPRGPLNLS